MLTRLKFRDIHVSVVAKRGIDRLSHPVDHDVGEQLVFAETPLDVAIAVAPRTELLHNPAS